VRLASPIGGATGGSGNLSTSLSNVAKQAAHPKFVWVFNCDGTIIYKDPVLVETVSFRSFCLVIALTQVCFPFHKNNKNCFFFLKKETYMILPTTLG
jgi:hypothetical protein